MECCGSEIECFARIERPRVGASSASLHCVLEQDSFILVSTDLLVNIRLDITEKMLTGALTIKSNKQKM